MAEKRTSLLIVTVCVLVFAGPLRAATDVLALAPDKALAVVVVNRIGETNGKLQRLARRIKAPLPGPLTLLKKVVGIKQGLDEQGSALLAVVAADGAITKPRPVAVVPVSDYAKFVAQFGGDSSAAITEVTVGGEQVLAAKQDGYAVLVGANSRELLERLLKTRGEISPAITPLKVWLSQNDVAGAVLPTGIELGLDAAIQGLEAIKQVVTAQRPSGPQAAQIAAAFDMYGQMFKFCRAEVDVAAIGVHIDQGGELRIGGRVHFRAGGQMARLPVGRGVAPTRLVRGLPADDYVFVGGGTWSPKLTEVMMQWSLGFMKSNSKLYGLEEISDAQLSKLIDVAKQSMKGIDAMGFRMAPGKVGDPIYSNLLITMRTPDNSEFLANYRKYIATWNDMTRGAKGGIAMKFAVAETTIAGRRSLLLTMDMRQVMMAQAKNTPEAAKVLQSMVEKLFGTGGKMQILLVPIDRTTVASGIGSKSQMTHAVQLIGHGAAGADESASIGKTARLLPRKVGMSCFVSPRGVVALASRLVQTFVPAGTAPEIPSMGETSPLGFAARLGPDQLETEMVVPAETLETIGGYIEQVRQ